MKKIIWSLLILCLSACSSKEDRAIEICKKAKITEMRIDNANIVTWEDYANSRVEQNPNEKYKWGAKKALEDGIYIVSFTNEEDWGNFWEVTLEQQTVRDIVSNEYLSRKYGFSEFDRNRNFVITEITTDTLSLERERIIYEYTKDKKVIYKLSGKIKNNTGKNLTSAEVKAELKVIFKDKTIMGVADYHYYSGSGWFTHKHSNFRNEVSISNPWLPDTERAFSLATKGIEEIYLDYEPEYVILEVHIEAEDPIGFYYDKNIEEYFLMEKWMNMKK
ncbi:MAG: hypothetical protein LBN27_07120 [Prevotellaceae bacterium]|jgi:hypothetical protein|nr:hypothetical protein [Prevotellaceae bacterium]